MPSCGMVTLAAYLLCVACSASEIGTTGAGSSLARRAVSDGMFAYHLANVNESPMYNPTTSAAGRAQLLAGEVDFCVTEDTFTIAEFEAYPELLVIPVLAGAVVPIYNIPDLPDASPLVLSKVLLSQIFLGNIQYWDDANITALNPTPLPHTKIQLVVRAEPSGTTHVFTSSLSAFDAEFNARIGTSETPVWKFAPPTHPCRVITTQVTCNQTNGCNWESVNSTLMCMPEFPRLFKEETNLGVAGKVAITPYSLGYAILSDASGQGVNFVSIQTQDGQEPVVASVESLTFTVLENGAQVMRNDGEVVKICNPNNPRAWPIAGYTYLAVLSNTSRDSTCESRRLAINFWTWFMSSSVMRDLAAQNQFVTTPDVIRRTNGLTEKLLSLRCANGELAIPAPPSSDYLSTGLSAGSMYSLFLLYLRLWSSENLVNRAQWRYEPEEAAVSVRGLMTFERGFSTAFPSLLSKQLRRQAATAGIRFMPLFFYASLPVVKLPFPASVGTSLIFDWAALGNVFTGKIKMWNDSALVTLNPGVTLPEKGINVVVATDAETASVFAQSLYQNSATFRAAVDAGLALAGLTEVSYPFNWTWGFPNLVIPSNFRLLRERNRPSQLLLLENEGYMSFRVFGPDPITDSAVILHQGVQMEFSPEGVRACYARGLSLVGAEVYANTNDAWAVAGGKGCWPFTQLATMAVYSSFNSRNSVMARPDLVAPCDSQHSLELLSWMYKNDALAGANALGIGWLPSKDRAVFAAQLERFTCDGTTILRKFPEVWELQTEALVFIIIASTLGMLLTVASAVVMYRFRLKLTFKKSGPEFMSIVLVGVGLMYLSVIFYAITPTPASCGLFYWFSNLGFTCVFGPLFLKNLRIYRIFLSSQFDVKTLSNRRMVAYFGVLLCFHIIIIALNQGLQPLLPVTSIAEFPDYEEFTQCNTDASTAWTFNLDMVYLAVMLLCNASLCFGVRHVDRSFNESKKIGFVVYNTILCYGVALLLLLTLDMKGTALVILFAMVIYWTTTFIVSIHFLVKARKVFMHKGNQGRDLENLRANLALTRAGPQVVRASEAVIPVGTNEAAGSMETRGRINTDPAEPVPGP